MPDGRRVVLVGHGGLTNSEVVTSLAGKMGADAAFVTGEPSLEAYLEGAKGEGEDVVVVPVLVAGGKTLRDVEEILEKSEADWVLAEPLGDHEGVVEALEARAEQALG